MLAGENRLQFYFAQFDLQQVVIGYPGNEKINVFVIIQIALVIWTGIGMMDFRPSPATITG